MSKATALMFLSIATNYSKKSDGYKVDKCEQNFHSPQGEAFLWKKYRPIKYVSFRTREHRSRFDSESVIKKLKSDEYRF